MTDEPTPRRRIGRTAVFTFLAVSAVSVTGALAIGANLGLLDRSDDDALGELAAAGDLLPQPQVIDVYVDDTTAATTTLPAATDLQTFAVDAAGTVTLATTGGLRVESIELAQGWSWAAQPAPAGAVAIRFTDGSRTLEFVATLAPDGSVAASVTEPIVEPSPVVAAPAPSPSVSGDDDHDDDHEEYEDEYEDEYEGGEDDD